VVPTIPHDLETIILKGGAKDPGQRYCSAQALADDLRRFLDDKPVQARRTSSLEHAWRWCRRNPAVALLTAAVAALVVGAAVTLLGVNFHLAAAHNAVSAALGEARQAQQAEG